MLRGFDDDLRAHMHIETERAGIKLTMKTTLTKIVKSGERLRVTLSNGEHVDTDRCCSPSAAIPTRAGSGSSAPA
jgi:glutathione reductase (NADPH)